MTKMTAQEKRFNGIRRVTELFIDVENGFQFKADAHVVEVITAIESLKALGRTERWQTAIQRWQMMVIDADNSAQDMDVWIRTMHWALIQGNIGAGHAA